MQWLLFPFYLRCIYMMWLAQPHRSLMQCLLTRNS